MEVSASSSFFTSQQLSLHLINLFLLFILLNFFGFTSQILLQSSSSWKKKYRELLKKFYGVTTQVYQFVILLYYLLFIVYIVDIRNTYKQSLFCLVLTSTDLWKMRVAELKQILDVWGEECRACAEKADLVNLIKELAPKYAATHPRTEL